MGNYHNVSAAMPQKKQLLLPSLHHISYIILCLIRKEIEKFEIRKLKYRSIVMFCLKLMYTIFQTFNKRQFQKKNQVVERKQHNPKSKAKNPAVVHVQYYRQIFKNQELISFSIRITISLKLDTNGILKEFNSLNFLTPKIPNNFSKSKQSPELFINIRKLLMGHQTVQLNNKQQIINIRKEKSVSFQTS